MGDNLESQTRHPSSVVQFDPSMQKSNSYVHRFGSLSGQTWCSKHGKITDRSSPQRGGKDPDSTWNNRRRAA